MNWSEDLLLYMGNKNLWPETNNEVQYTGGICVVECQ